MKIIFIGCVKSSEILLRALIHHGAEIVGVITKQSSKSNADFSNLAKICEEQQYDYLYVTDINSEESIRFMKEREPVVIYCFGWSQLIKEEILRIPALGVVGFHPAALPHNKGRHPIIWALVLGLQETASTFFWMTEKADDGDILAQETIPILLKDDAGTLYHKIMQVAEKQVIEITEKLIQGSVIGRRQDPLAGNVWRKRSEADGVIDWRMGTKAIYNLVRALTHPYIGAEFNYHDKAYKVWKAAGKEGNEYPNQEYGKVLRVYEDGSFLVKTGDGVILILDSECDKIQEGDYL